MRCWLAGAYALDDDEGRHLGRPITVELEAQIPSWRRALAARAIEVDGELSAESLASRRPVSGTVSFTTVSFATASARYGLRFEDDEGRPHTIVGEQQLTLGRPPRGFSVITGELIRSGRRVGTLRLRLDPRNGMKGLLRWA